RTLCQSFDSAVDHARRGSFWPQLLSSAKCRRGSHRQQGEGRMTDCSGRVKCALPQERQADERLHQKQAELPKEAAALPCYAFETLPYAATVLARTHTLGRASRGGIVRPNLAVSKPNGNACG